MNKEALQHLDKKQLLEQKKYLEDEIVRLKLFSDLGNTHEGKFILGWIDNRKRNLREFYAAIPPASPSVGVILAGVQGAELELTALMDRILDAEKYKKELELQLDYVVSLVMKGEERTQVPRTTRLVPEV